MDTQDAGGYDYTFVSDVANDLTCVMCHFVMKDPVQVVDCGHRFCKSCFERLKEFSVTRGTELCCPLDRGVIDPVKVFVDKAAERNVMNLIVKCTNHNEGCAWAKELGNLEIHIDRDCGYELVKCENDECALMVQRRFLEKHRLLCRKDGHSAVFDQFRRKYEDNEKLLAQKLQEKDDKILALETKITQKLLEIETRISEKDRKISSLENTVTVQAEQINKLIIDNHKLAVLNPKMSSFEWQVFDYEYLKFIDDVVYSPEFYSSFSGHCCKLSIEWHGKRQGRLSVSFHLCRKSDMPSTDFVHSVFIKCFGVAGIIEEWEITRDECISFKEALNFDDDYSQHSPGIQITCFLSMPKLEDYIINDTIRFTCTIK